METTEFLSKNIPFLATKICMPVLLCDELLFMQAITNKQYDILVKDKKTFSEKKMSQSILSFASKKGSAWIHTHLLDAMERSGEEHLIKYFEKNTMEYHSDILSEILTIFQKESLRDKRYAIDGQSLVHTVLRRYMGLKETHRPLILRIVNALSACEEALESGSEKIRSLVLLKSLYDISLFLTDIEMVNNR